jgi:hypothetical protein
MLVYSYGVDPQQYHSEYITIKLAAGRLLHSHISAVLKRVNHDIAEKYARHVWRRPFRRSFLWGVHFDPPKNPDLCDRAPLSSTDCRSCHGAGSPSTSTPLQCYCRLLNDFTLQRFKARCHPPPRLMLGRCPRCSDRSTRCRNLCRCRIYSLIITFHTNHPLGAGVVPDVSVAASPSVESLGGVASLGGDSGGSVVIVVLS